MEKKILNFWKNKRVLITGHTGFKGAWMSLILSQLRSKVIGYSLKPKKEQKLYKYFDLEKKLYYSTFDDVLNRKKLKKVINKFKPQIVFHFAAQSLVIDSFQKPFQTVNSNVVGLTNLLEFCNNKYTKSIVIVTSDKCYDNSQNYKYFSENSRLGGKDIYSSSKACAELITNSFRKSFYDNRKIATVRAGNVIGGGDFSNNRIVPDFFKSVYEKKKLIIRNPNHIRPWQHIFDVLNGYMILAEKIYLDDIKYSEAWNFGPQNKNNIKVKYLISKFNKYLKKPIKIKLIQKKNYFEEEKIFLNSKKSRLKLKWSSKFDIDQSIENIFDWYNNLNNNNNILQKSESQINKYFFNI